MSSAPPLVIFLVGWSVGSVQSVRQIACLHCYKRAVT